MSLPTPEYQPISDIKWYVRKLYENRQLTPPSHREIHKSLHHLLTKGTIVALANLHLENKISYGRHGLSRDEIVPKEFWINYDIDDFESHIDRRLIWRLDTNRQYGSYFESIRIETKKIDDSFGPKEDSLGPNLEVKEVLIFEVPPWRSPYISLLLKAEKELGAKLQNSVVNKDILVEELYQMGRKALGSDWTKKKADVGITLLRHPDFEKGGNKRVK